MQVKKPRAPMTAEHKAKLAAAYEAKRTELERQRVNGDERLNKFLATFLYPLIVTYLQFINSGEDSTPSGNKVKFNRYQKTDKLGKPVGRPSCSLEISVDFIAETYGRPAAELFKRLFKRTSKGGWSRKASAAYNSTWVVNAEVFEPVLEAIKSRVLARESIELHELVSLINSTVEYQYVPTYFFCQKLSNGLYKVVGDKSSKRMVGPDVRAKLKVERDVLKQRCDALNSALKEQAAVERAINLDMQLKLLAVKTRVEQLLLEAGVAE